MKIQRMELHEILPLSMPLSLHIYPSFYCNFKCKYCLHSMSEEALAQKHFKRQYMDFETYQHVIDDVASQGWHLKAMIFAGHGEPLLHKNIAEMVAYAKERQIADRIEIVTNGSLLIPSLSDALISAGLDRLRISLQGVSAEEYLEMSGVKIDFERFIQQLDYFYTHKTATEVYIKIIDLALKEDGDREKFEKLFCHLADVTAIEYAIPFINEIDLGALSGNCKQGEQKRSNICSMPFYMLVVYPDGTILPCCSSDIPIRLGTIKDHTLCEIWDSKARKQFLLQQLDGTDTNPICRGCCVPEFGLQEGDYLDQYREELKQRFREYIVDRG